MAAAVAWRSSPEAQALLKAEAALLKAAAKGGRTTVDLDKEFSGAQGCAKKGLARAAKRRRTAKLTKYQGLSLYDAWDRFRQALHQLCVTFPADVALSELSAHPDGQGFLKQVRLGVYLHPPVTVPLVPTYWGTTLTSKALAYNLGQGAGWQWSHPNGYLPRLADADVEANDPMLLDTDAGDCQVKPVLRVLTAG